MGGGGRNGGGSCVLSGCAGPAWGSHMTALKTTPGGTDSNAYVDATYVDENIIGWGVDAASAWLDLRTKSGSPPFDEQEALILEASRKIDQYPQSRDGAGGWGGRQNTDQRMAFPRAQADAVGMIHEGVKRAVDRFCDEYGFAVRAQVKTTVWLEYKKEYSNGH